MTDEEKARYLICAVMLIFAVFFPNLQPYMLTLAGLVFPTSHALDKIYTGVNNGSSGTS